MQGTESRLWNFVLTGNVRSGASAVISGINGYGDAVCHSGLFDSNPDVCRSSHERYFGESSDDMPEWYVSGITNPWQHINTRILDNPARGEAAVGVHLTYDMMTRFDLFDLWEQRSRVGSFSIIQVIRNPVACFVSLKQAEQSGVWVRKWNDATPARLPSPIRLDAAELMAFCDSHDTTYAKIRTSCEDRLEIHYKDLLTDYQHVMATVFDYIELPPKPVLAKPTYRRLRNRQILDRVSNWAEVRLGVSTHVKRLIESDDLV